ncbi:MAG TPA: hypothetical protein DD490_31305 [Acidobacteria bacterium]|nr:hypothetical protein [Acidobacteriota bacterium]
MRGEAPPPAWTIEAEILDPGVLPFSGELCEALAVKAGDRVALVPFPLSWRLLRLAEVELYEADAAWFFVAALGGTGLPLPSAWCTFAPGRRVLLQVLQRGEGLVEVHLVDLAAGSAQ